MENEKKTYKIGIRKVDFETIEEDGFLSILLYDGNTLVLIHEDEDGNLDKRGLEVKGE